MTEKKELTLRQYDIAAPDQMAAMADVLKSHVIKHGLFTPIADKNYVHVEGWQFAGGLLGTYPRISGIENLSAGTEKKWMARAEIVRMKDGVVIGFGAALCSNLETKKRSFDEYAVLSMAQTRAIGKAYRNSIGWVMKLAGYESTPAEEMVKPHLTYSEGFVDEDPTPEEIDTAFGKAKQVIKSAKTATRLGEIRKHVVDYPQGTGKDKLTNQQKIKLYGLIESRKASFGKGN